MDGLPLFMPSTCNGTAKALVDSTRSRIYQQAENRLYAQQALMLHLLHLDA